MDRTPRICVTPLETPGVSVSQSNAFVGGPVVGADRKGLVDTFPGAREKFAMGFRRSVQHAWGVLADLRRVKLYWWPMGTIQLEVSWGERRRGHRPNPAQDTPVTWNVRWPRYIQAYGLGSPVPRLSGPLTIGTRV